MKRFLHLVVISVLLVTTKVTAQDIPLFSQKLTNAFMYNPAIAGNTFGSVTLSYRQNYGKVSGAPTNYFLSVHTPIANHKAGIGANFFQEDVTFLRNTYASAAFAYHIQFNDRFTKLSMGVSGEYNSIGLNGSKLSGSELDPEYIALQQGNQNTYDFSFGLHFQNRYLKAGVAANRLKASWFEETPTLSNYYSSFIQGLLPVRGGNDLLEPYVAYRQLSPTNSTVDVGLYYTFNEKITAGAAWRSGNVISATLGLHVSKYLTLGYSHENILGSVGGFVGSANEFTLRYDFNNESYKNRFQADYKSALSYRRKTLSAPVGKVGVKSPQQAHRKQKKLSPYSPNKRYQSIKKLGIKSSQTYKRKTQPKRKKTSLPKRRK